MCICIDREKVERKREERVVVRGEEGTCSVLVLSIDSFADVVLSEQTHATKIFDRH